MWTAATTERTAVAQSPLRRTHVTPVEQLAAVQRELDRLCVLRFTNGLGVRERARYDRLTHLELALMEFVRHDQGSASAN